MKKTVKGGGNRARSDLSGAPPDFRVSVGERIGWLLDQFPTRAAAADVAGVNRDQLAKYVTGAAKPPLEVIARLCNAKGASIEWLATGTGERILSLNAQSGVVDVPFYDVRAGAGALQLAHDETPSSKYGFDTGFISTLGVKAASALIIIADGDSMRPTIEHGDPMFVDAGERDVRDGVYIVRRGEGVLVKRLQRRADGSLLMISDNPAYKPEELPRDDADNLHLIGRVKFVFRRL
ncbi:MAG TPA: S24 family peptidase [Rhizomicrobium sp.]|jgi:SOS-response transcriptional repressor LexA